MRIMEVVWLVTAIYFGPATVWMYWRYDRANSGRSLRRHKLDQPPDKPKWATTVIA